MEAEGGQVLITQEDDTLDAGAGEIFSESFPQNVNRKKSE